MSLRKSTLNESLPTFPEIPKPSELQKVMQEMADTVTQDIENNGKIDIDQIKARGTIQIKEDPDNDERLDHGEGKYRYTYKV